MPNEVERWYIRWNDRLQQSKLGSKPRAQTHFAPFRTNVVVFDFNSVFTLKWEQACIHEKPW